MKTPKLASWSWQDIQALYRIYSGQLLEYKDIADRFEIKLPMEHPMQFAPGQIIPIKDANHQDFINRWFRDVNKLNNQVSVLDQEIARRNNLIGVIG